MPAILGVRAAAVSSCTTILSLPRRPSPSSLTPPAFFLLEQSSSELAPLAIAGRNTPPPLKPLSIPRALSSLTTPSTFPDPHLSSSPAELAETLTLPSAAIGANPSLAAAMAWRACGPKIGEGAVWAPWRAGPSHQSLF